MVLTGGTAALRGIHASAGKVMHLPARVAQPDDITGLVDKLQNPAYSTSVGLLRFANRVAAMPGSDGGPKRGRGKVEMPNVGKALGDFFGRLLPD